MLCSQNVRIERDPLSPFPILDRPPLQHLRSLLAASPVKMVVLTTPGNPTGAVCPESLLKEVAALCRKAGAWLVVDESYEHFLHEGARHVSLCASAYVRESNLDVFVFLPTRNRPSLYCITPCLSGSALMRLFPHPHPVHSLPSRPCVQFPGSFLTLVVSILHPSIVLLQSRFFRVGTRVFLLQVLRHGGVAVGVSSLPPGPEDGPPFPARHDPYARGHGLASCGVGSFGSWERGESRHGEGGGTRSLPVHAGCPPRACPSGPSLTPLSTTRTAMQWVQRQVAGLTDCRERLWAVLSKHCPGSVRTEGAFYFLAQLPPHVSEAEAVHRLATEYRVLCTPGEAFGAPGTLRLSYGSLPPAECIDALGRLDAGLAALIKEGTDKVSQKKTSILV